MIAVTHLLGTGHLSRALTLAHSFRKAGHDVLLASGGLPVPHLNTDGLTIVQLPPIQSDGTDFTRLLDAEGAPATPDYLAQRARTLVETVQGFVPDCLICELFPFGRRILADEFLELLATARALTPAPKILCSIRDILAPPSKPAKAERADEIIATWFDTVLVHSDPQLTRLEASWPVSDRLAAALTYTGYVAPPTSGPHPDELGQGEVLVTAGGGSVGDALFSTVLQAAALDPGRSWRVLVGGADAPARIASLSDRATANVTVERTRPEFRQMLHHAAVSVGMCGYNTTLDILQAGTPAVLVPFDDGNEVEQTLRADSLTGQPAITVRRGDTLTGAGLLSAIEEVTMGPRRDVTGFNFDGAGETVRIAEHLLAERTC